MLTKCLLPLANIPLIEYTLECLSTSGVQEIFIVCRAHARLIEEYIHASNWSQKGVGPSVKVIVSQELRSIGDAIRDLDSKQLLQSDFILTSGDIVSNLSLMPLVEKHKKRRKADPNAIMTVLLREAGPNHPSRARTEQQLYLIDSNTNQLISFETYEKFNSRQRASLDTKHFKNRNEISLRTDFIDCQIDICSLEVPALFTENFDYQEVRHDFLPGVLESEILGKNIYCEIVSSGYSAAASCLQMYSAISMDVLKRWAYPLCPDNFSQAGQSYTHSIKNVYEARNTDIDRTSILDYEVQVGFGTIIKQNGKISNSVIGNNCIIGKNVVLDYAFVFDNTKIGDNCKIYKSVISTGCIVFDNVVLNKGCLLGPNVVIGPSVEIPTKTLVSIEVADAASPAGAAGQLGSVNLGADSVGTIFEPDIYEEEILKFQRGAVGIFC